MNSVSLKIKILHAVRSTITVIAELLVNKPTPNITKECNPAQSSFEVEQV